MYGENLGTGTLTEMLVWHAEQLRDMWNDGHPADEEVLDAARFLMEGSMVLWMTVVEEAAE